MTSIHCARRWARILPVSLVAATVLTTVAAPAEAVALRSVRDARCCKDLARCADCQAKLDEVRAARRDALIHAVASVRPRRAVL